MPHPLAHIDTNAIRAEQQYHDAISRVWDVPVDEIEEFGVTVERRRDDGEDAYFERERELRDAKN